MGFIISETCLKLLYYICLCISSCFRYVKDTILKAIHNSGAEANDGCIVVSDMSKIQFWKQFTTVYKATKKKNELFQICQRYNFESNSQHKTPYRRTRIGCFRYVKDTILKAIHNLYIFNLEWCYVVSDMSKIQFWKQFTTWNTTFTAIGKLFQICQRYNFESNSQPNRCSR